MNDKHNCFIDSDKYFNHPDTFADYELFGDHVIPVDINGAAVPRDKDDRSNIVDAQESIRKRFALGR